MTLTSPIIRTAGLFDPTAREFIELRSLFKTPFVVDSSHYRRTFGDDATPYREGIRQTLTALGYGGM